MLVCWPLPDAGLGAAAEFGHHGQRCFECLILVGVSCLSFQIDCENFKRSVWEFIYQPVDVASDDVSRRWLLGSIHSPRCLLVR